MRLRLATATVLLLLSFPAFAAITGTVMTAEGQPVSGAKIALLACEPGEARLARLLAGGVDPAPLVSATSDTKGNFSLESPKLVVADLQIDAAGYEPVTKRVEKDEELGALVLRKIERKTGRIMAGGKPVANARVIWWSDTTTPRAVATTDAEGRYSAPDPRNAHSVTVIHPDYAVVQETFDRSTRPTSLDRTLIAGKALTGRVVGTDGETPVAKATISIDRWPLATTGEDGTFTLAHVNPKWKTLVASSGSLIAVRTRAAKDEPLTIRLSKAATITGTVRDSRSPSPIAGAQVRIGAARRDDSLAWNTLTDAKGNFSVTVPGGAYQLMAIHPGYATGMADVSVPSGQTASKDLSLTPWARVAGTVLDEERKPVAAALLTGEETNTDFLMRFAGRDTTSMAPPYSGPDGRFIARVRADADLRLRASKKGLPVAKSDPLRLAAGERKRGVVITMPTGIAVTGRVTDGDGGPLSGVTVAAAEAEAGPGGPMMRRNIVIRGDSSEEEDLVTTGSDGTFVIRLKEGTYDFAFRREGYATRTVRSHPVGNDPKPVEATLDPAVEITGRVVRGGVGLEGVSLFTFGSDMQSNSATTGPDGSFTLAGLTPGMTRISVRKEDDFIQEQRNVTAPMRDVIIEIPPGGRVSGRVVDKSSRRPVTSFQAGISTSRSSGGSMQVLMMSPPLLRSFESEDGSFVLENVPAGAVNLVVTAPGYAQGRKGGLTLEEGKSLSDVEVELDTGVKLTGRVTGPDGSPLGGVTVRATQGGAGRGMMISSPTDPRTTTETNGEYTLDALEAGEKSFEFVHGKYLPMRKTVELTGRETRLDVRLESGARVAGTVVTDSGTPVAEANVNVEGGNVFGRGVKTDANGAFAIDNLQPGRYTFRASRSGYSEGRLADVDISSGAPIKIVLGQGGVLYGHISGLTADEYPHTIVEARNSKGSSTAAVDASGNYRLEGASVGTTRVLASVSRDFSARKSSQARTVEVTAGGSEQVDLEFRTDVAVRGRVVRDGRAMAGATVMFVPRNPGAQTFASTPADHQGNYTITGLDDGEYTVHVSDDQRLTQYQTRYEVRGSGTFNIDYRTSGLRGRVLDAATGEPLTNARIQVRAAGNEAVFTTRGAATDGGGLFAFDFVPAGTYVLTAEKDGYGSDMRDVLVSESAIEELELKLSRNDGVLLTVVDGRDRRPLNASVFVTNGAGQMVYESMFRFGDTDPMRLPLSPGSYRVTVMANGYAARSMSVTSPSRQEIPLTPGGTLVVRSGDSTRRRARLIDASGAIYARSPRQNWLAIEASPGMTTIEHIAPGTYTLQILGNNDAVIERTEVTVLEGVAVTVDI